MKFQQFSFGQIRIDGIEYGYDVVIDRGKVGKRKKKASKKFREAFGHTPLSLEEKIPWKCSRLVVGTGEGALPVMDEVKREAKRRKVELSPRKAPVVVIHCRCTGAPWAWSTYQAHPSPQKPALHPQPQIIQIMLYIGRQLQICNGVRTIEPP